MNLYDYVFALWVKGLSIIPTPCHSKKPLIEWKKYQTQQITEAELQTWFKDKTFKQVGLASLTGKQSGLVVVDSDNGEYSPHGLETPLRVKTARGYHLYFKYPSDIEIHNTAHLDNEKLDIRGEGGYVMIPYTWHESGVRYTWVSNETDRIQNFIPHFDNLPELPSWLKDRLKAGNNIPSQKYDWNKAFHIKEGEGRDDALFRGARSLLAKGIDLTVVIEMVHGMNATYNPPLSEKDVQKKIEQAVNYYKAGKPVPAMPKTVADLLPEWEEMKKLEAEAPSTGFGGLDRIIKGFIPGHLYTLTAETNSGKTQLAVNFAVSVAKQGKKVAYIALEPDINIITAINACWFDTSYEKAPKISDTKDIHIYLQRDIPNMKTLENTLEYYVNQYNLIIIDHIGYFIGDTNNTTQEQSNLLKKLAILTKTTKCAIMIIAHPRKIMGERIGLNDISGSAAFKQDSTEVMILYRAKQNKKNEYDMTLSEEGYLTIAKTKVTTQSHESYIKVKFRKDHVKLIEIGEVPEPPELDNTDLVDSNLFD